MQFLKKGKLCLTTAKYLNVLYIIKWLCLTWSQIMLSIHYFIFMYFNQQVPNYSLVLLKVGLCSIADY